MSDDYRCHWSKGRELPFETTEINLAINPYNMNEILWIGADNTGSCYIYNTKQNEFKKIEGIPNIYEMRRCRNRIATFKNGRKYQLLSYLPRRGSSRKGHFLILDLFTFQWIELSLKISENMEITNSFILAPRSLFFKDFYNPTLLHAMGNLAIY